MDAEALCAPFMDAIEPAGDAAPPTDPSCFPTDLYYGEYGDGVGADYAQARACAFAERAKGHSGGDFEPAGILMMVYANGLGVPRNLPLAKKFACEVQGSLAELEGRLRHLEEMAQKPGGTPEFDLCQHITSGYMQGYCATRHAAAEGHRRSVAIEALQRDWSPAQRGEYERLSSVAADYFSAVVENEVDMGGTGRVAWAIEAGEQCEKDFLERLQRYERGELPKATAREFKQADAELNRVYLRVLQALKPDKDGYAPMGSVRPDGVRRAEAAWIPYRDAWVAFGKVKYPAVSADAWRTELTRQRTGKLREMLSD